MEQENRGPVGVVTEKQVCPVSFSGTELLPRGAWNLPPSSFRPAPVWLSPSGCFLFCEVWIDELYVLARVLGMEGNGIRAEPMDVWQGETCPLTLHKLYPLWMEEYGLAKLVLNDLENFRCGTLRRFYTDRALYLARSQRREK